MTTADHDARRQLIMRALMAFNTGDDEAMKGVLAEDFVWHVSGNNPMAGVHHGHAAVVRLHGIIREVMQGQPKVVPHDILVSDDHVVVLAKVESERKGVSYEGNLGYIFHIRDGVVSEGWIFQEDQNKWDEWLAL